MLGFLTQFASTAAEEVAEGSDLFGSLGINWTTLGLQALAFVVLVFILAKFIYPSISAMLDRRDKIIADSMKAAQEAEENAAKSEAETAKLLSDAREEATEIIDTAKKESADMLVDAEAEAAKRAFNLVAAGRAELEKEVESARKALRTETLNLVAQATEKIAGVKLDGQDEKIVNQAIREDK